MSDTQKWLKRIPGLLTFFMVIALGVTLANLLWLILTPVTSVAQAANLQSTNQVASIARQENYGKLIADQHIFGAIPKQAPTTIKAPPPAPKKVAPVVRNLNLKLFGTFAANSRKGGYAMISYNGKSQETYKLGEAIPKEDKDNKRELEGVSVKHITPTSVTIDNNGTEQLIELPNLTTISKTGEVEAKKPAIQRPTIIKPKTASSANSALPAATASPNGLETLAQLRDKTIENPNYIMSIITPSIVRKNGAVTGVRVYPSRNRPMFRALGFRNGDIITQVNDVVIDGPDKGMLIFQQLAGASSLSIHILRGGNEQILTPSF